MYIVGLIASMVAAQEGCFDTIDGNKILNCVCDSSCLTCRVGAPPPSDDCFTCFDDYDWMSIRDGLDADVGKCVAKDYGFLVDWSDDMRGASNGLMVVIPAVSAALMLS